MNAIVTQSGNQLEDLAPQKEALETKKKGKAKIEYEKGSEDNSVVQTVKPPPPCPQKFKKQKEDECLVSFSLCLRKFTLMCLFLMVCREYQSIPSL